MRYMIVVLLAACASSDGGDGAMDAAPPDGTTTGSDGGGGDAGTEGGPAPIGGLRLFFSDLLSGPNSGGQANKGAFVTVWGNGFGDTRGSSTVTIGGGAADNYPIWTSTKISFQLGAAAMSGDIVVHVMGQGDSNPLPFTVRAGNIYFATSGGSDAASGSFLAPFKTIPHAKDALKPGDIAYLGTSAGDTISQTTLEAYNAALTMSLNGGAHSGTKDNPKALVAYPGAKAIVGVDSGIERGILTPAITGAWDYWVISQLELHGQTEALELEGAATGWRVIGCDMTCPNGTGKSGCVTGGDATSPIDLKFFGNVVHDAASNVQAITKYYHGIYFGSNHLELGWNTVRDGKTCRAIQFHDTGGPNEFDVQVHDNVIHGTTCDGLNFATVDPSQGSVRAWNNIIYDVGRGPDPVDGSSDYACIYVANITNQGNPGSGSVEIFNNTLYDCGSRKTSAAGAIAIATGPVGVKLTNNLIFALPGESYFSGDASNVTGSNNLFFGGSMIPGALTASVTMDPMFIAPAAHDFHLQKGSPAIDTGVPTTATFDYDGNARPQGTAFDIGAYERAK